jgi:hypothetical protein
MIWESSSESVLLSNAIAGQKPYAIPLGGTGRDVPSVDQLKGEGGRRMIDHDNVFDLNAILHPGSVFNHPRDVVNDPTISIGEKRSWASDAAAVASNPALRELPGSHPVTIDEILEALSALDPGPPKGPPGGKPARVKSTSRVGLAA